MKRYVSRFLKSVSILYMGFPIAYIIGVMLLFDVPAGAATSILLSPRYYFLSVMAIAVGYGLWEMKRWSWYLFVVANILITYQNAVIAVDYGESHYRILAFVFSLSVLAFLTYWVAREVRVPYFFPKIRWWESDPRYRLSVPVRVTREGGQPLPADILDISMGGCFIKLRTDLVEDERVGLEFSVFGIEIRCEGSVVWRTKSTVTHPKGVGVKFTALGINERRALRNVNSRLRKIASFYKRSRYLLNQDEFLQKLHELEAGTTAAATPERKSVQ